MFLSSTRENLTHPIYFLHHQVVHVFVPVPHISTVTLSDPSLKQFKPCLFCSMIHVQKELIILANFVREKEYDAE